MVHELLSTITNVSTENLEKVVCEKHVPCDGWYFILHRDYLEGPYKHTKDKPMPEDKLEWFLVRDFFSLWLNNDANKAFSNKSKNYLSSMYLDLFFKSENSKEVFEKKSFIVDAAINQNKICESIPEAYNFNKDDESFFMEVIDNLFDSIDLAISKICELTGEDNIKKEKIKIFYDAPVNKYIEEGKKYLFCSLFNKGKTKILDGKTYGPSTFCINMNENKKYVIPREMIYQAPFNISLMEAYRLYLYQLVIRRQSKYGVTYIKYDNSDLSDTNDENINGYKITTEPSGKNIVVIDFSDVVKKERSSNFQTRNYVCFEKFSSLPIAASIKKYTLGMGIKKEADEKNDDNYFYDRKNKSLDSWVSMYQEALDDYVETGNISLPLYNSLWQKTYEQLKSFDPYDSLSIFKCRNAVNTFLNIKYNLKGERDMRDVFNIQSDEDYFFAAGQLAYFLASKSASEKAKQKNISNFIRLNSDMSIKNNLRNLMSKYQLTPTKKYSKLVSVVFGYTPKKFCANSFIEGIYTENIIYKKEENNEEN